MRRQLLGALVTGMLVAALAPGHAAPVGTAGMPGVTGGAVVAAPAPTGVRGVLQVLVRGQGTYRVRGGKWSKTAQVSRTWRVRPGTYRVRAGSGSVSRSQVRVRPGRVTRVRVRFATPTVPEPETPVTPVPPVTPPPSTGTVPNLDNLLVLINDFRSQPRYCKPSTLPAAPALQYDPDLTAAAQAIANDMMARHWFDHWSPEGWRARDWVAKTNYKGSLTLIGENLARGGTRETSVYNMWVASPGHCANLMWSEANRIGLAVAYGPDPALWTPVDGAPNTYVWVMLFGNVDSRR